MMQRLISGGKKGGAGRWGARVLLACLCHAGLVGCHWDFSAECAADDCDPPAEGPSTEGLPAGVQTCEIPTLNGPVLGACIPYIDAGWHTALVQMAPPVPEGLHCPLTAPNAGLRGEEILEGDGEPRLVIACSVNPAPTCPSIADACVPWEVGYPPCVLQDSHAECPPPYSLPTLVEPHGTHDQSTVCCLSWEEAR